MVQYNDTAGLTADEQRHVDQATARILTMLRGIPKATQFGDSLRNLADMVDLAPSIWTARKHANIPAHFSFGVSVPEMVSHIARDLGTEVEDRIDEEGLLHTWTEIHCDLVTLRIFSLTEPEQVLRRPVEVTPTIEEQAA